MLDFPDPIRAFLWVGGTQKSLGSLPGGTNAAEAGAISSDGEVIVGESDSASGFQAFHLDGGVWTGLGVLPGGARSRAQGVSDLGQVVVGRSDVGGSNAAFIWDRVNGLRNLQDVLVTVEGLDLTGWTLEVATGISNDATSVVGYGTNPNGDTEGWIATMPACPGIDSDSDGLRDGPEPVPRKLIFISGIYSSPVI